MKKILCFFLVTSIFLVALGGCQVVAPPFPNDHQDASIPTQVTEESTPQKAKQLTYEVSAIYHPLKIPKEECSIVLVVCTVEELASLYGGVIPPEKSGHDERFFASHFLIILAHMSGGMPFALVPGEITLGEDGVYHLALEGYSPEWVSTVCGYHSLVLEVEGTWDPNDRVVIDYMDHILDHDTFYSRFPNV